MNRLAHIIIAIAFTWRPNAEPDLIGYRLFWGPQPQAYTNSLFIAAPYTGAALPALPGEQYYALSAVNWSGAESDRTADLAVTNNLLITQEIQQSESLTGPWVTLTNTTWVARATNTVFFRGKLTIRTLP